MPFNFYAETSLTDIYGHGYLASAAVQRQTFADSQYLVLPAATYSVEVLSWTKKTSVQKMSSWNLETLTALSLDSDSHSRYSFSTSISTFSALQVSRLCVVQIYILRTYLLYLLTYLLRTTDDAFVSGRPSASAATH